MTMDERTHERHNMMRAGTITFPNGGEPLQCIVRNASEAGALIEVLRTGVVPTVFQLTAEGLGQKRPCIVVRRTKRMLGVTFGS